MSWKVFDPIKNRITQRWNIPGIPHILPEILLMLNCHLQHHNDTIIKTHAGRLLYKNIFVPLTLFVRVRKGYSRFYGERELETEHNCNILTPTLMAVSVVSFSFSRVAQPEAQGPTLLGDSFLYCIFSIFSGPQLIRAPRPQGLMWLSLPHLVYNSVSNSNCNSSGAPRTPSVWCGFPYHISSITPSEL